MTSLPQKNPKFGHSFGKKDRLWEQMRGVGAVTDFCKLDSWPVDFACAIRAAMEEYFFVFLHSGSPHDMSTFSGQPPRGRSQSGHSGCSEWKSLSARKTSAGMRESNAA